MPGNEGEGYDAGEAFLQIVPSFRGVLESITTEAAKWGAAAGRRFSDTFNDEVKRNTNNAPIGPSDEQTRRQGQKSGRTFADSFKAQIEAALRSLPDVKIDADSSEADRKVAELRAQLVELSGKRIGVDLGAEEALVEIERIKGQLDELARESPDVSVQINTARASAELARLQAEIDRLRTEEPEIKVKADTAEAKAKLAALKAEADSAGRSHFLSVIFSGEAAIAGLEHVLDLLSLVSKGAVITPILGGLAALGGPLAAIGLGGAGTIAATLPALGAVRTALQDNKTAQKAAGDAAGSSASQQITAAEQVKAAELSLAQTRRQITNDEISSAEQIKNAEQSVTDAQNALNSSREQAARDLEDAQNKARDSVLSLQQAQLDLNQANAIYQNSLANPAVPAAQLAQEKLNVAKAQSALAEAQETSTRAQADANKATKDGVDKAPAVVSAQQSLAKAQQQLADARRQQTLQAANDAASLEQAEMSLASAQRSQAQAAEGGSTASRNLAADLAKMDPLQRQLYTTIQASKKEFDAWGKSLEPATLPLVTDLLKFLTTLMPVLSPLIRAFAVALDGVVKQFTLIVQSPGFKQFIATLTSLVGPAIQSIAIFVENLGRAFASAIKAFAPLTAVVEKGLDTLSGSLARAAQSPGLTKFVDTLVKLAPVLLSTFERVGGLIATIFQTLAPLAKPVFSVIGQLATTLGAIVKTIAPSVQHLFDTLAPVLDKVLKVAGPAIGQVLNALISAVTPLLPLLGQLITTLLPPLATVITDVVNALAPFIEQLVQALQPVLPVIGQALVGLVNAMAPLWPLLGQVLIALIPLIEPLAKLFVQIWGLEADVIPAFILVLKLLMPILHILVTVLGFVIQVVSDVIGWIRDAIKWFGHLGDTAKTIGHAISVAWDAVWSGLKTAWTTVRDWLVGEWKKFTKIAGDLWDDIAGGVSDAWGAVVDAVKSVWRGIENVFAGAVNFVTQDILNPLIRILNDVLGAFGVHINPISKITIANDASTSKSVGFTGSAAADHRYALGGVLPGYSPGVDNISLPQILFSGGEGILVPEATRALGGAPGIQAINSMFSNRVASPGHFAGGGVLEAAVGPYDEKAIWMWLLQHQKDKGLFGDVGSFIGGAIGDVVDWVRSGLADIVVAGLKVAESPIKAVLGLAPSGFAKAISHGVFDKLNSKVDSFIRGGGSNTGDNAAKAIGGKPRDGLMQELVKVALGMSGVKDNSFNEAAVNTIVEHESGWNPWAINLTDSNAAAGHPSMGLMQTIISTFEAHRLKSLPDDPFDPLANLVAGIRYAVGRYGSLAQVPGIVALSNGGKYVGYDSGGVLQPGLTLAYNGTGKAEVVAPYETFENVAKNLPDRLVGGRFVLDAGSIGQLTGHIELTADGRLAAATVDARARTGRIT